MEEPNTKLPIPEVGREKAFFAEESILIAQKAQEADDITTRLNLEDHAVNRDQKTIDSLRSQETTAYLEFLSEAKGLMRALKPHLAAEDKEKFQEIWEDLKDLTNPDLYSPNIVDELSNFILQCLKNANLSELGVKSRIDEIVNEIDIEGI